MVIDEFTCITETDEYQSSHIHHKEEENDGT